MRACAIILSGGASRRFQVPGEPHVDKALYPVDGEPMIMHSYAAARVVSSEVIVAVNDWRRAARYSMLDAKFVVDEGAAGPLGGIASGLRACSGDVALVLPNDMPRITASSLSTLLSGLAGFQASSFMLPNGFLEAVMAIEVGIGRRLLGLLLSRGRSKVTDIFRGLPRVSLLSASKRGVAGELVNVNARGDLNAAAPRGGFAVEDIEIIRDFSLDSLDGSDLNKSLWGTLLSGDPWGEVEFYVGVGAPFLAGHALLDSPNSRVRMVGRALLNGLALDSAEAESPEQPAHD